jgi:hypothetical protein
LGHIIRLAQVAAQSRLFEGFPANMNSRKTLRLFDRWSPKNAEAQIDRTVRGSSAEHRESAG